MPEKKKSGSMAAGLVAGALAGATVALLFAPKVGKETRNIVQRKSKEYYGFIREKLGRNEDSESKDN